MDTAASTGESNGEKGIEDLTTHLRRRCEEIGERIEQVKERQGKIAAHLAPESSMENADAATHQCVEQGRAHAAQAHQRAAEGHEQAAELHERAAVVLDEHGRPERAHAHREAARHDRDDAATDRQAAESEQH